MANEWQFQGHVLGWMSRDVHARPHLGIAGVEQEKTHANRKRSDLIVWSAVGSDALAAIELKTVRTPLTDAAFQDDLIKKARRLGAPFCVMWNMRETALFATPPKQPSAEGIVEVFKADDRLWRFPELVEITSSDYESSPAKMVRLEDRAHELFTALAAVRDTGVVSGTIVEPSIFVSWLGHEVREIRKAVAIGVRTAAASDRRLIQRLTTWAKTQGLAASRPDLVYQTAAAQLTYRILGQSLFYLAYVGHTKGLPAFKVLPGKPLRQQLQTFWTEIRKIDYEALYAEDAVLDKLPLSGAAEASLVTLLDRLDGYDWTGLDTDVLGAVFENLIPEDERSLLGQYFTPALLAELIVAFCVDGSTQRILDPACGTGEFLVRAYDRLRHLPTSNSHGDRLEAIWGVDISPFPTELAVINLCRQDFTETNNFPRVITKDFFRLEVGQKHSFPPAKASLGQQKIPITVPQFDAVIGNPPYVRWQATDDLDPDYRAQLQRFAVKHKVGDLMNTDVYVLFFVQALRMLKPGGRLGFVTSSAWLATEYGAALQRYLLTHSNIVAIVGSDAEPFFPQAAINTVTTICEKPDPSATLDDVLRFATIKLPLRTIIDRHGGSRWDALDGLIANIESAVDPQEDDVLRIHIGSQATELAALQANTRVRPWNVASAGSQDAARVRADGLPRMKLAACRLDELADIHLGGQTYLNDFFYVDDETVAKWNIESRFLSPVVRTVDVDSIRVGQSASQASKRLFMLRQRVETLVGTGAAAYVHWGATQRHTDRDGNPTILWSETPKLQDARPWYFIRSLPAQTRILILKAFDERYAPFVFDAPVRADQRFNHVTVLPGVDEDALVGLLSSAWFAMTMETFGGTAMGQGALELRTEILRGLPVPDLRSVTSNELSALGLAATVLRNGPRLATGDLRASAPQRVLDGVLLDAIGIGEGRREELYNEVERLRAVRKLLSQGRGQIKRERFVADTTQVADDIAAQARAVLPGKRFPEDYLPAKASTEPVQLGDGAIILDAAPAMLGQRLVQVTNEDAVIYERTLDEQSAEVFIRAVQLGRRDFPLPTVPEEAETAVQAFERAIAKLDVLIGQLSGAVTGPARAQVRQLAEQGLNLPIALLMGDVSGKYLSGHN